MDKFYKKEDREKIELLNQLFHTSHRNKPYDLNKEEDIIELVEMISGEYVDFHRYAAEIESLAEELDKSIESYYPNEYAKHMGDDKLIGRAVDVLENNALDALQKLADRSDDKLVMIWKIVLTTEMFAVHNYFFEETIDILPKYIENRIKDFLLFEMNIFQEYSYTASESGKFIARCLKEDISTWKANDNE